MAPRDPQCAPADPPSPFPPAPPAPLPHQPVDPLVPLHSTFNLIVGPLRSPEVPNKSPEAQNIKEFHAFLDFREDMDIAM